MREINRWARVIEGRAERLAPFFFCKSFCDISEFLRVEVALQEALEAGAVAGFVPFFFCLVAQVDFVGRDSSVAALPQNDA